MIKRREIKIKINNALNRKNFRDAVEKQKVNIINNANRFEILD